MKSTNDEGPTVAAVGLQGQTTADPAIVADTPRRVQMFLRRKGYRIPADVINVTRPTKWANPYKVKEYGRERAIELYRGWLFGKLSAGELDLAELRGRKLGCWCRPDQECHADLLLSLANASGGKP
jgi:hypothetical protein